MDRPNNVEVAHVSEYADAIPMMAYWGFQEWGHLSPDATLEQTVARYHQRLQVGKIPYALVAVLDGQVIGMASLVKNDLTLRPDLTPWMASVYVDAPFRNRGVGSQIVLAVMKEARTLSVDVLYLITHDRVSFYRYLGWQEMESVHYRGEDVTIMHYAVPD